MACHVPFVVTAALVLPALGGGVAAQLILPAQGKPCFDGSSWCNPDANHSAAISAAVDLNADGFPDMVLAGTAVHTLLNDGHGVFVPNDSTVTVPQAQHIAAGDLDGDGLVDLVLGTDSGIVVQPPYGITTLLGDGAGRLTLVGLQPAESVRALTLGDFDQDGRLDVVASHGGSGSVLQLLHGQGDGTLAPPVQTPGSFSNGVDAGDWDQDGDLDVLIGAAVSISLLRGDGAGGFSLGPTAGQPAGSQVKLVDIDQQDGLDAVCVSSGSLVWRPQNSQGNFDAPISFPVGDGGMLAVSSIPAPDGAAPIVTVAAGGNPVTRFHVAGGTLVADPTVQFLDAVDSISLADFDGDDQADLLATSSGNAITSQATVLFADGPDLQTASHLALAANASGATNFAVRDISGDGDPDLVLVGNSSGKLQVALGGPGASFGAWHGQPTALQAVDMALVDETSDGQLDVLTLCAASSATLGVHPGDGAGSFAAQLLTPVTASPMTFAIGDVNGDGQPDAVVLGQPGQLNTVQVYEGAGNGSFVPAGSSVLVFGAVASTGVSLGDFDLDGDLDAASVLGGSALPGAVLLLSYGDGQGGLAGGTLAVPLQVTLSLAPQGGIVTGDFDADGLEDLGLTCRNGGSVALLTRDPAGGFRAPVLGGFPDTDAFSLIAADVDGDGKLDLAHSTQDFGVVAVVRGDGAGGFLSTTAHPASHGGGTRVLATADIDQDGLTDLVQLGAQDKDITLLRRLGSADDPWSSIGGGIPGAMGQPRAQGSGDPVPGGTVVLQVDFAAPGAPTFLVAGAALLDVPFKGGQLVPQPQLVLATGPADANGRLKLAFSWPAGIPSGIELWLQSFIADPAAAHGFAATGGLRLTVP